MHTHQLHDISLKFKFKNATSSANSYVVTPYSVRKASFLFQQSQGKGHFFSTRIRNLITQLKWYHYVSREALISADCCIDGDI